MAKPEIELVTTEGTFQSWLDRTNEVVTILQNEVITASLLGDTTGSSGTPMIATLIGSFTASNIIASDTLRTNSLQPKVGSSAINLAGQLSITSAVQNAVTFTSNSGARTTYASPSLSWVVGFQNEVTNNFIIDSGAGSPELSLTTGGNLSVSGNISATGNFNGNLTGDVTGDIFASNGTTIVLNNGNGTSVPATFTGNVTGAVTGTVSSISNHTTNALAEGTNNLYFTQARARGSISALVGGGLSYNATTGVMSIPDSYIRGLITGSTGVTYNSTTGAISIGQPVATTSNVQFANIIATGTITATGAISSNGDITAFASSSDIRKKENITRIDDALNKVVSIGGYTYNFLGDNRRITGVIAQELETVLPEAVYEIDDDEFGGKSKAVRYGNVIGLLIEAIKELKAEVDELRSNPADHK
jgi:hypothetical protein